MSNTPSRSRRQFLRESFAYSALALLGSRSASRAAASPDAAARHLLMMGDWGLDGKKEQQVSVAHAMQNFARSHQLKTDALLMLGDNFYGPMPGLEKSPRWQTGFEQMYPRSIFNCPCYAILGNHDYHVEPAGKSDAQLAYAHSSGTRWQMPAKWYRFDFPAIDPLVTFIALDSNYQTATDKKLSLTTEERTRQLEWLKAELAKPRQTKYLIIFGHHPLYSNGTHGDTKALIETWDPLFREHGAHLYFCGHDHDMQHIEFEGHPTSFVVSGGGGAGLTQMKRPPSERGPFGQSIIGFTHLQITPEKLSIQHVGSAGQLLHGFTKTPDGKMAIL